MNIQTVKLKDMSFITVTNPGDLEVKYLKNNFGFDTLHLDDYANKNQIPKIEVFRNYLLMVLDFPHFHNNTLPPSSPKTDDANKSALGTLLTLPPVPAVALPQFSVTEKKKRLLTSQVYFFIGKDYLVVLHEGVLNPVNEIFAACQKTLRNRNEYMGEGPVFLAYRIIDAMVDTCFPIINDLSTSIERIDRQLEDKPSQDIIENISLTRRNIVVFQTIIKPILPLLRQLEEGRFEELNGSMQPFWSNVLDHLQKIWDRLEDSRELIEGISESNESLLSYRNNEIIKVLTIFSAVILPLNLIASLYGMNIHLPFAQSGESFELILLIMVAISLVMFLFFRARRWF